MMLAQSNRLKTTDLHLSRIFNFVEYTLSKTYMHINIHVKNAVSTLSVWLHTFAYVLDHSPTFAREVFPWAFKQQCTNIYYQNTISGLDNSPKFNFYYKMVIKQNNELKVVISINQPYQDKMKNMECRKSIAMLRHSAHILE